ncbi:hypothetical protein ACFWMJ_23755 [Streptomyces hawaiiensis]|uniref:hypothetical protein n=1 Tax=Streptomyces hawaiiensis TaxID=67305 RepID=UPI003664DE99
MSRRTLARRNSLLTFAAQPWTLFEDDPGAGGGGGGTGAPQVNEHGYPDGKPVAEMEPAQQVAYWKHHARKHEQRANAAPDAAELERLRAAEAELNTRKAAELSETERLQKERDDAAALAATNAATAAAATAELLKLKVIGEKELTPAHAPFITGTTREELEASADALKALFPATGTGQGGNPGGTSRSGGNRGSDVGNTSSVSAGAERYAQKHGK